MTEQNNNQNQNGQQQDQNQNQNQDLNNQGQGNEQGQDAKFTQDDLNKFATKVRAEEKAKYDKLQAELKRQQDLAAMQETDRLKAEKEDAEKRLQEMQKQIDYNNQRTSTIAKLSEAKLDIN